MNWDATIAISEIVSAIAVVGTLFYLSRQIRESNSYSKANTIRESNSMYMQSYALLAQDNELASIHVRAVDREPLDQVETLRFTAYLTNYFAMAEAIYFQCKADYVFSEYLDDGDASIELFRPYISQLLNTIPGKAWWNVDAPNSFSAEFIERVNHIALTNFPEQMENAT
jgi:hypothetical protein